jgi:hypothetical protein
MTLTYSNPTLEKTIPDWPSGSRRVLARFHVEGRPGNQRVVRVTTGAPKKRTYALAVRIVDGSDGRTYIAELSGSHVTIFCGNMQYQHETIFPDNPRYAAVRGLFR